MPATTTPRQPESYLQADAEGRITSYVGPDATRLFQAIAIKQGLTMWLRFKIIPTRGANLTYMLKCAAAFSGRTYKRTEVPQAIADLQVWIATMQSALPIRTLQS